MINCNNTLGVYMREEKITLPKELQKEMIRFFLETSIPKKKKAKMNILSENKITDRRKEK